LAVKNYPFTLSIEQEAAVNSDAKQLCILACAGSGKTTTLTRRIARLINDNGIDPSKVAAITFTVLAGDNLKYELSRVLKDRSAASRMFVGTIHSFCFQLLISERILSAEAFEPISESQQFILLTKNWLYWKIQRVDPTLDRSSLVERLMASFDIIKMNGVSLDRLQGAHPEVARTYELYNGYLTDNGFIDYADMLTKVHYLLFNDNQARSRCVERFPYVFVDEYQDVDPIQAGIIDIFKQTADVCVVGDDDQAIYQFRGADERNIQAFSQSEGCTTSPLSENRRCPKNILTISGSNISKVSKRLPKSMYTKTASGLISVQQFPNIEDELEYIVATIKQLMSTKVITSYGQIGILLRSMASYGSMYVNALKTAGIPCLARGARTLFSSPEIEKVVAIIEWFAKDTDAIEYITGLSPLFSKLINIQVFPAIEKSSLLTEADFQAAGLLSTDWSLFNHLQDLRTKYEERKFGSLLELVHRFIEELDLFNPKGDSIVKHNIAQLTRIVGEYEKIEDNKSFRSLAAFLAAYARNSYDEVSPPDIRADAVNILTIHQSKGLEFDFVFLPMLVEGRFPLERSAKRWLIDDGLFDSDRYMTSLDNERRLFYVACTRARKALYLLASQDVGLMKPKSPSLFWNEVSRAQIPDKNQVPVRANRARANEQYLVTGYSSLEYYLTCPYRYQLIVDYGLEFPQAVFFQFGKLMHDVLASINSAALSGHPLTLDEAQAFLDRNFALYYKNTNMRQYDIRKQQLRAVHAIETYYAQRAEWMSNLVGIEGDLAYTTDQALIRGRYDALVRNKRGKHTVIDYKTGQPHAGLRTDFQMQFYCLAVDAQLHIEVDEAVVYYVEADKPTIFNITSEFLHEGEENLTRTINGIIAKEFPATPHKGICAQCEARRLCPYKTP
jgi:DNA helicase-2/ATP-dependent DNA helicase PcrA